MGSINSLIGSSVPEDFSNADPYVRGISIDLNEVLKETLARYRSDNPGVAIILRCETLPAVVVKKQEIVILFDRIIGMIVKHAPLSSKLFLHIDCIEEAARNRSAGDAS